MYQQRKLVSNHPGPYNQDSNVEFDIQHQGVVDMTKSYLNIKASITTTPVGTAKAGFYQVDLSDATSTHTPLTNAVMISNARYSIDSNVQEEINKSNVLSQNLKAYTRNFEDLKSQNYYSVGQNQDSDLDAYDRWLSPFCTTYKNGSIASTEKQASLRCPLSDLGLGIGLVDALDTSQRHQLRVTIDKRYLTPKLHRIYNDHADADERLDINNYTAPAGPDINYGTDVTMLNTTDFDAPDSFRLCVGQAIEVSYVLHGGAAALHEAIITTIGWVNGIVAITLDTPIVVPGGQAVTATSIICSECTMDWSIDDLELVLYSIHPADPRSKSASKQIVFSTWLLEQSTMAAGFTNYEKIFQLEPLTMNVLILAPVGADSPLSRKDTLIDYRLRLNNIDLTSRSILYNDSLYKDRIIMTFNNMGKNYKLKSLNSTYPSGVDPLSLICNPIPVLEERQQLQLSMNGTAFAGKTLHIYKQVIRTINLK